MKRKVIIIAILGILALACGLPIQVTFNTPTAPAQTEMDLALTITAQALTIAESFNKNSVATNTPEVPSIESTTTPIPSTKTDSSSDTPAPVPSPTSSITVMSVSVDTNCRIGPGQAYDIVGALLVGETAEVVGKNSNSDNWIVKNPDNPSSTCWLWGEYATIIGDQSGLPEVSIPPTPTPAIPAAPSNLSESSVCYEQSPILIYDGTLTWQDNSNNEDGFRIYRRDDGIGGAVDVSEGTVGPNATSYQFSVGHFGSGQTVLKVEAFNSAGTSKRVSVLLNVDNCP